MTITDVSITLFRWDIPAWKAGKRTYGGERHLGVVTIHTDEGVDGHAFLGTARVNADMYSGPLMEWLKPTVVGCNPLDTGALWTAMWKHNRYVPASAIGAMDVALWDVAGKVAKLPIHRLLGTCRESVPAYASSAYLPTPEAYAEEALHFLSLGWPAYKVHPCGTLKEDAAICRTVRKAVGDRMVLMLDAMWAYNYEDALRLGREVEDLKYFWYEDPLADDDIYGYVKLHSKLDIPILSTEHVPGGFHSMANWILQGATDMLRGDVMVTGGITPLIKVAHMADGFRMKCEIHHGGNSLGNAANLHVMMAINNCDYYEVFPASGANKYGLVEDIEVDKQGLVHAPQKPGLGFEIDWELVKRNTVAVLK